MLNKYQGVIRVKPVSGFKNNSPPSINLRVVLLHLMWQQLAGGLLSLWADGRSTPLIPVCTGWMGKTEDSTARGSNRPAPLHRYGPSALSALLDKKEEGGEEEEKRSEVLVFPWESSLGGGTFLQGVSSMRNYNTFHFDPVTNRSTYIQHCTFRLILLEQAVWKIRPAVVYMFLIDFK